MASTMLEACGPEDGDQHRNDVPDSGILDDDADPGEGPDSLYAPDQLLDVALEVDEADWDLLRLEGRSVNQAFSGCIDPGFAYTFVTANLRIDGEAYADVRVRKKGFLGSISTLRPSLRVDVAKTDPRQRVHGQKDLTFNNNRTDPSQLHQCLAYAVYGAAGIPVPRCSFARITVNDRDLGIYTHVEPAKKPWLRRHFGDDSGNLYEGNAGADFVAGALSAFEKKTHEDDPDTSDLDAVRVALESSGAAMLEQLANWVDVDQFLRFWAVETLIGHWDGYTGNKNNFFVYRNPASGKFVFLPWGPDDAFSRNHPLIGEGARPPATYASSRLARRLYEYEPTRRRYQAQLRELLDTVWDEAALLEEIDRMVSLLGAAVSPPHLEALRAFVRSRRADVESELASLDSPWAVPERLVTACQRDAETDASGSFATEWGMLESPQPSTAATLDVSIDRIPQAFDRVLNGAGSYLVETGTLTHAIRVIGVYPDNTLTVVQLSLGAPPAAPGEIPLHGFETIGYVLTGTTATGFTLIGYIGDGSIHFEEAADVPGAPLIGHFQGRFIQTRRRP